MRNTVLLSLHTLWMREHNNLCEELSIEFPEWDTKRRFNVARKIVGSLLQEVVYDEWLPSITGRNGMPPYSGYNDSVDPRVSLFFAGSAFRLGHVMINDDIVVRLNDGREVFLNVESTLFAPSIMREHGMDAIIRGAVTNTCAQKSSRSESACCYEGNNSEKYRAY